MWEECHDATLVAWGVVYGDTPHGMPCFNNVGELRAPTGAHVATAINKLHAWLDKMAREEVPAWL